MNFRMILASSLLVLIVVGMGKFGYTVYAIHAESTTLAGPAVVKAQKWKMITQLVIDLLQFAVAGFVVYKT